MALGELRRNAIERTPLSSAQFRAVIGLALFIMFGFGLVVPILPLFVRRFGLAEAAVGLLLTVFAATRLGADFVAGRLIDRFGEQRMAAAGAAIVGVSSILAGAAPNYPLLVAFRGIGGIGSAFFLGALMAYLIGTVAEDQRGRAMSVFQATIGIGLLLGPAFGGLIAAASSVNVPLYAYGAICLAAAPLCVRVMTGAPVPSDALADAPALPTEGEAAPPPRAPAWAVLRPLFRDSAYRAALMGTACGFFVSGALQTLIPGLWVDVLHRSKGAVGTPFTVLALASLAVVWHAGSVSDRRGRKFAFAPALALMAVATFSMGYATSAAALLGLVALIGVASGYARPGPTAIVADVAPPGGRGVAVSGYRTAGDVGALLGPIIVGVVAQTVGYRWAFASTAVITAVAFALVVVARETAPRVLAGAPRRSAPEQA